MQGRMAEGREAGMEGMKAARPDDKAGRRGRRASCPAAFGFCLPAFCFSALLVSGCVHAQAKSTPDLPPLTMPAPPPRDVEPAEVEAPTPVPLAVEPARTPPARPRPVPPAPKPEPPKTEPPKVDAPVEPPKPPDEPARPPTTLQTTPATAEGEVERGIRGTLQRASTDLNRVDYRALNADARTQYDTAKRFVTTADEAIRTKNLVYAKNLAEKAATIAAQLAGR
jgi:outer membrane biosynthesis protein TonB